MISLFSYLLTFMGIAFWFFRVIATFLFQIGSDFFAKPINLEAEIVKKEFELNSKFDINPKYDKVNLGCEFCSFKDLCFMQEQDQKYLSKVDDLSFLGGEE